MGLSRRTPLHRTRRRGTAGHEKHQDRHRDAGRSTCECIALHRLDGRRKPGDASTDAPDVALHGCIAFWCRYRDPAPCSYPHPPRPIHIFCGVPFPWCLSRWDEAWPCHGATRVCPASTDGSSTAVGVGGSVAAFSGTGGGCSVEAGRRRFQRV